jgi:hypothetical protein
VNPGDELFGSITYVPASNSYDVYHNSSDGWEVTTNIPIQKKNGNFKNYSSALRVAARAPHSLRDHLPDSRHTTHPCRSRVLCV